MRISLFAEAREKLEIVARAVPDSIAVHRDLASVYTRLQLPSKAAQEHAVVNRLERMSTRSNTLTVKDLAPDFDLQEVNSQKKVSLREFRQKSPVVLVFGSYTCPEFRDSADVLKSLYSRYGQRLPFFLVYIREAHATNNWQSTQNEREGVSLPPARTMVEKSEHAVMCTRKLHLPFTALVDGMDGRVEKAYSAWPSHVFVISMDGRILYTSGLSQQDFQPKALENALNIAIGERTGSKRVAAYP